MQEQKINFVVETITPQIAKTYLKSNSDKQRCVNRAHIDFLTDQILKGQWVVNGDSIRFDGDGNLIDGQHRLNAIIKANMPIESVVIRELPQIAIYTIDKCRVRSVSDTLKVNNVKNNALVSTVIRSYHSFKKYRQPRAGFEYLKLSSIDCVDEYINNKQLYDDILAVVIRGYKSCRAVTQSVAGGLMLLLINDRGCDKDYVLKWFNDLYNGTCLSQSSIDLRNLLINDKITKKNRATEIYIYFAKAWNNDITGKHTKRLKVGPTETDIEFMKTGIF